MRIIKTEVVSHSEGSNSSKSRSIARPVYSLDFQPFNNRFATAGGDYCVKIWSISAVLGSAEIANNALVATLTSHTMSVNAVRWATDGRFLASASDDSFVMVYKLAPNSISTQTFGCKAPKNKENWVRCFVCHGHSLDVLDLDWSPTHFLASASVDNTIMIWNIPLNDNAAVNLSPIHILREHNSFVRGVSFDPIGQYLVSCAADNSVIVWNCESQFSVAAELPEVLKDSPDSTLFRRISWSPDGQCVCLSAATRSDKPVGVILKRGSWESLGDLVGHNGSVAGSSFCPNVFYGPLDSAIVSSSTVTSSSTTVANGGTNTSSADEGNSQHDPNTSESSNLSAESIAKPVAAVPKKISDPRCVVAVGDKKGVISLWGTHTHRPILTISSLFAGAVTDISWAHSHPRNPRQFQILGMASMDGTVALVDLTGDIGSAMNNSELDQHFLALYSLSRKDLSVRKPFTAIPLAAMYRNARNNPVKTNHIISSRMNTSMPPPQRQPPKIAPNSSAAAVTSSAPTQNQVVIVNGKKRIRPMLIQSGVNGSSSTAVNNLAEEVRGETVQRGDTLDFSGFDPSDDYQYQSFHDRTSTAQATNGSVKRFKATNQGADRNISYNFAVTNSMDKFLSFHHSTGKVVTTLPSLRQQHSASNNASTKKIVIDKVVTTQLHVLRLRKSRPIEISLDNFERIMKTAPSKKPVTVDSIDELVEDAVKSLRCKLHRHQNSWTLSCSRASKPKSLRNLSHSGGHFSTVSLLRSGSSINSKTEEGLWSTVLVGEVTCISGCVNASVPIDADNSSSASTNGLPSSDAVVMNELNDIVAMYRGKANDMISTSNTLQTLTGTVEGVVVVGCSDGSIYLLDLSSGLRLGAPVVIGMPVAYLDTSLVVDKNRSIQEHYFASLGSSSTSSSQTLSTSVRLLACSATGDLYAWDYGPNRQLVAQLKTTVRPVLDCMKFSSEHEFWHVHLESDRNSATNSSVVSNSESIKSVYVEDCQLTEYGSVLVKCSASHTGCGGIWRSYIYDIEGDVWTKIADNNHKLSRYAASPPALSTKLPRDPIGDVQQRGLTLSQMETTAFERDTNLDTRLELERIQQQSSETEKKQLTRWEEMSTWSHVEERLSISMKYGTKNDVNIWFSAWIKLCCRDGHFERVLWVIGKLIDNHRDIGLRSTAEIEDLASWLETIAEPLDIIRNIILPELAQICSNTKTDDGSDESKQSKSAKELLLKIHKSLELFT